MQWGSLIFFCHLKICCTCARCCRREYNDHGKNNVSIRFCLISCLHKSESFLYTRTRLNSCCLPDSLLWMNLNEVSANIFIKREFGFEACWIYVQLLFFSCWTQPLRGLDSTFESLISSLIIKFYFLNILFILYFWITSSFQILSLIVTKHFCLLKIKIKSKHCGFVIIPVVPTHIELWPQNQGTHRTLISVYCYTPTKHNN